MRRSLFRTHTRTLTRAASMEPLEIRQVMSGSLIRSMDGTGNNLANPAWGSAGEALLRTVAAAYADGVSAPAGADRPGARLISNTIGQQLEDAAPSERNLSAFVYVWGQFLDHDLDLTVNGSPAEPFNVSVPVDDALFDPNGTGTAVIRLNRSAYDPATGTSADNPREQTNVITAWIDGSVVYGSDATRAAALRTFVGGKLQTSQGDLLPFNTEGLPNANDAHIVADAALFLAGDVRANENVDLTALHTLFVREHNRIATQLAAANRRLSDEDLYQRARQIVGAEIQSITYNEFLPALLGRGAIDRYRGYDATVNPGIANEFSTAAFRVGHTLLGDDVEFLGNDGEEVRAELELAEAFFNPEVVREVGIDPILKYLASDRAQEVDTRIVDGVRNFLFGPPGAGGFDLASLNIQRGRDHGLADYNTTRAAYGLPRVTSFAQITSDAELAAQLEELYGSVDDIDLWVGGLAEDHVSGSSVGPLFRAILSDQFERLRDGDRLWYEAALPRAQRDSVARTTLADVIRRNSTTTNLQSNVFVFDVTLSGTVFNDANRSGRRDLREQGLSGWTVQVLDTDGGVVAERVTDRSGRYSFGGLDLGTYRVNVVTPAGWARVGRAPATLNITRGMNVTNVDYGYARTGTTTS